MNRFILKLGVFLLLAVLPTLSYADSPNDTPPKKVITRAVYSYVPEGYSQVGNTDIYVCQDSKSIDVIGKFGDQYYSSTYGNGGYKLAMKVGDNYATSVDCYNGTTVDSVNCTVSVLPQGELARIVYTVNNLSDCDTVVSLGTHADVMIGDNDRAPISRRIDTLGNTYGLTMRDGNGAELCVLFGSGLVGVTGVSDYWFGVYYINSDPSQMVGNYSSGSNFMEENGSYDSGMGWCWKNRTIPANSSVEFSYLIGVGDVNLEPNSSFEVTPDDPEGWNDLSLPHRLTLEGEYESPAGQNGKIQYVVEDSEEWLDLTDEIESGSSFTATLVAMFDADKENHTIRFRTVDAVGNTTLLTPIIYKDVSYHPVLGIEEKYYNWGDSIYQTDLTCDLPSDQYLIGHYRNNKNAGIATFNIEGVFPHSIGRKTYSYTILPLPLSGEVFLDQDQFVYDGTSQRPEWQFSDEMLNQLVEDVDYDEVWENNVVPGTGSLHIVGKGNFSHELVAEFFIDKAPLNPDHYNVTLPDEDVTYDNQPHGADVLTSPGVGEAFIYYASTEEGSLSQEMPKEAGSYDIYLEFSDGEFYYGQPLEKIFSFTIYHFNESEWQIINALTPMLIERGWSDPWNLSEGIACASHLQGLTIEQGNVVGLDLSNCSLTGMFPVELLSFPNLRSLIISGNEFEGLVEVVASYVHQNSEVGGCLEELNIADNRLSGNLGILAACFSELRSIDARGNCLSDVYPMISEKVINLNISGQTIDRIVEYDLSNTSMEELAQQIPTILLYDHTTQSYTKPLNLRCSMEDGFGMTLSYSNGHIEILDVSEQNAYHGESGDIMDVTAMTSNSNDADSTLKLKLIFEDGDANFSGSVDILDLQTTIAFMFDEYINRPFNFTAANFWPDETINVQDAVCMINKIMESQPNLNTSNREKGSVIFGEAKSCEAEIGIEDGKLILDSNIPVASFDLIISGDVSIDLGLLETIYGLEYIVKECPYGLRVIAYSLTGATIPEGHNILGAIDNGAITFAMLSDISAEEILAVVNNNYQSNINDLRESEMIRVNNDGINIQNFGKKNVRCEIYDMQGHCLMSDNYTGVTAAIFIPYKFIDNTPYICRIYFGDELIKTEKIILTK